MSQWQIITAQKLESLSPVPNRQEKNIRIALIQHKFQEPDALAMHLEEAVSLAASSGAQVVFMPEVTFLRYPADVLPESESIADALAEDPDNGYSVTWAKKMAKKYSIIMHIHIFEKSPANDGRGYNTSILISPEAKIIAKTHKLHIPITAGYYEDHYFRPGSSLGANKKGPYEVYETNYLNNARIGLPTCWDEWFPEVARLYSLGGANMVVYPTAIGSEPDYPNFDTKPLWQQVIVANGVANGLFMIVPNRTGIEIKPDGSEGNTFYGSSFISDPYGRIIAQAPRNEEALIIADLDLSMREDWLALFPFLKTRRPDTYSALIEEVNENKPFGG